MKAFVVTRSTPASVIVKNVANPATIVIEGLIVAVND